MRIVVQRVTGASLSLIEARGEREHALIGAGLVALVGVQTGDTPADAEWAGEKLTNLRVFEDDSGRMNLSVLDAGGSALLVPNFTVAGTARKGRRPSFDGAMRPPEAERLFDLVCARARSLGVPVQTGVFGAHMRVHIENDGPVTIWLDSRE